MYLADCPLRLCEWDILVKTQEYGEFIELMHLLVKHPEHFQTHTKVPNEVWERKMFDLYGKDAWEMMIKDI